MRKMQSVIVGLIAITIGSCNSAKEGCYSSYTDTPEMQVASSLQEPRGTYITNEIVTTEFLQKPSKNIQRVEPEMAGAKEVGRDLLAQTSALPPQDEYSSEQMRIQMVTTLKTIAGTTDSRFANRVLARTATRLEKSTIITERSGIMYRIKNKIAQKVFSGVIAAPMSGSDVLAIVSLVTGIFAFAYYAAFVLGVAAIVTGSIALVRGTDRRGMAIVGIVFGAIAIALWSGLFAGSIF